MNRQDAIKQVNRVYDVIDFICDEYKELKERKQNLWLQGLELTEHDKVQYQLLEHLVNIYLGETTEERKRRIEHDLFS